MKRFFVMLLAAMLCLPCAAAETFTVEMSLEEILDIGLYYKQKAEEATPHNPAETWTRRMACDVYGEEAEKWLTIAAEAGNPQAMSALGALYFDNVYLPVDGERGVAWLTKAAEAGDAQAMYKLGSHGTDWEKRRFWLEKAAVLGHTDAMRNLGTLYCMQRVEGEKYEAQAEKWYLMALEAGNSSALQDLYVFYCLTEREEKAIAVCEEQAEKGNVNAMEWLVDLYLGYVIKETPPEDLASAAMWCQRAAEAGSTDAMNMLGIMYGQPDFGMLDEEEARFWTRCAALLGHPDAIRRLEAVE